MLSTNLYTKKTSKPLNNFLTTLKKVLILGLVLI
jgi:hypothetical protein